MCHRVTKSYGYDPFGLTLSLTNAPTSATPSAVGKAGTYTYAYDVHGSVSALLDGGGNVEASYGYDAYGKSDPELWPSRTLFRGRLRFSQDRLGRR